ncbi:MAG: hypothetical protein IKU52_00855 [Clostridia bacterium]|nr:hypothetical protein [Clostridia bacterium]
MDERIKIDPLAYGFFKNEDAEIIERTADALVEGAKNIEIAFNRHLLPHVWCHVSGGAGFSYEYGLDYNFDPSRLEQRIEKYPQHAEYITRVRDGFRFFHDGCYRDYYTATQRVMMESGAMWGGTWEGHSNPDFGRIINLGTNGIRKLIAEYKEKNLYDTDWFYRALEKTLDAIDIFGDRFRELAIKLAAETDDPKTKKRYERTAEAFAVIPREPAYDFNSAILAFWFIFSFDGVDSPGRFDQYMYRCYAVEQDKEERAEMLERLWETFHDSRTWNLCLAGSDENWNDTANELTFDILKLAAEKKYETPNLTLRVHRNTSEELWEQIAKTTASGIGMPALYNDEIVCPALESIGIPPVHSHEYCMNGCNQIDIFGKSHMGLEDGEVFFAKCLEYTLHSGKNALNGNIETLFSGNAREFKTYEDLERAFYKQLEYATFLACTWANSAQAHRAKYKPNPLRSLLIEGCIEKGKDYRNGGPLYGHGQILAEGIADAGDSLYAVKKLVFDEKKYTMDELITALEANWEGYEKMRAEFANCEKFGNDCDEVDAITAKMLNRFFKVLKRTNTYRGGVYTGGCSPFSRAAGYGRQLAAMPNGRKAKDPIIADSTGPVPGCAYNGPTAILNSVLKFDHWNAGSGFILNVKFDKTLFDTEQGYANFIALAKAYFGMGAQQLTSTVIDPAELLDALEHPENHKDLIVRVGGFSAKFVEIDRGLQENVIKRAIMNE